MPRVQIPPGRASYGITVTADVTSAVNAHPGRHPLRVFVMGERGINREAGFLRPKRRHAPGATNLPRR
jgi:hypothetical protein